MAEWVNAFTQGACEIDVYRAGSLIAPANYAANNIASVQEVGGRVVVTSTNGQEVPAIDVRVRPLYDTTGMSVRVRDAELTIAAGPGFAYTPVGQAAVWWQTPPLTSVISMTGHPTAYMSPASVEFEIYPDESWVSAGLVERTPA